MVKCIYAKCLATEKKQTKKTTKISKDWETLCENIWYFNKFGRVGMWRKGILCFDALGRE